MSPLPKLSPAVSSVLIWTLIATHGVIFVFDVTQLVPQHDFVTRGDGSASDKYNLLPLELIYAGITGLAFGTVGAAFLFAALGFGPVGFAAAVSVFTHTSWLLHIAYRWDAWTAMMHPDGSMTPQFFIMTHLVFLVMSALLLAPPEPKAKAS